MASTTQDYYQQYYAQYYQQQQQAGGTYPPAAYAQSYSQAYTPPTQPPLPTEDTKAPPPEPGTDPPPTDTSVPISTQALTSSYWTTQYPQTTQVWSETSQPYTTWSQTNQPNTTWSQMNQPNAQWSQAGQPNTAQWPQTSQPNTAQWPQTSQPNTAQWPQTSQPNTAQWSQTGQPNTAQWTGWNQPNYQWGWGGWQPPSPWVPGQTAWAGATPPPNTVVQTEDRAKSPGTPPLNEGDVPSIETTEEPLPNHSVTMDNPSQGQQVYPEPASLLGSKHSRPEGNDDNVIGGKKSRHESGDPLQQEETSGAGVDKWPPKLKEYVARAFNACSGEEEREYVHRVLDDQLNTMFSEKTQWSIDWDTYPLPTDRIRKAKTTSRWDTPSPTLDLTSEPSTSGRGIHARVGLLGSSPAGRGRNVGAVGRGRVGVAEGRVGVAEGSPVGRGRGKKKRNKKGKRWGTPIEDPPSAQERQRFSERAQRFGKQGAAEGNKNIKKKISMDELLKRTLTSGGDDNLVYWQDTNLEGTCQSLEKRYLRLNSAPEPSVVRPLAVLKRSLDHVCGKWEIKKDYHYACEQLKSIRQDLTIQAIRNNFTVLVYETHGRVALQNGDHQEFNQCQTQLKNLYSEGLTGHQAEFLAYRILYYILTDSSADMSSALLELTPELRSDPCVEHALGVWRAWSLGNYYRLFRLYACGPSLSRELMRLFVERERKSALRVITRAYRPSVSVERITSELKFGSRDECVQFLVDANAVLDPTQNTLDCKLTAANL